MEIILGRLRVSYVSIANSLLEIDYKFLTLGNINSL